MFASMVSSGGRAVVNRGDGGSITISQNVGNFVHLTLPVSFGRNTKSRWSLLSGVYARGSKRSHTGGKNQDRQYSSHKHMANIE